MTDIAALRQERARVYDQLTALQTTAETAGRGLTAEEQTQFDSLVASIEGLDGRIKTAERLQTLRASAAIPAPATAAATLVPSAGISQAGAIAAVAAAVAERAEPGVAMAQIVRALVVGRGNVDAAATFAAQTWGEGHEVTAALQANDASAGGFLVPERMSAEIIELLRPRTVVRRNARVVPLIGGTDTIPTVEEGTAAYYIGEGKDIVTTEPKFGQLKMVEREIAAIVPISNKLLRNASRNVDQLTRDDLVQAFAQAEDLAFLRGSGVGAGPRGLRYLAPSANILATTTPTTVATIDKDARRALNQMAYSDSPLINVRWVMNPRDFGWLQDLRDGNGNAVYPSLQNAVPAWKGYPVEVTNNVPRNLGSNGNESEIYLVDFGLAIIADTFQVRIDSSESASYKIGNEVVSAYSRNQTLIRAVAAHDFGIARPSAIAILTGVTWGA